MNESKSLDAGHFSLLEMIKVIYTISGPGNAKGTLIRTGIATAEECKEVAFDAIDDYVRSIDELANPIAQFEGQARHYGDGVYGLPLCPFARSISTFTSVAGKLPAEYVEVTEKLNEPSGMTDQLRIGAGAAVSPFCGVHQTVRSKLGSTRVKVGGKSLVVTQLGCKAASGKKGISQRLCEDACVPTNQVAEILDANMCCYKVRVEE